MGLTGGDGSGMTQETRAKVKNFVNGWTLKDLITAGGVAWLIFQRWNDVGVLKTQSIAHAETLQQHTALIGSMTTIEEVQKTRLEDLQRRVAVLEERRQ